MNKSLKKTVAVALAVATTAGIAGGTSLATTKVNSNNQTNIVVKADSATENYMTISGYKKKVNLYSEFTLPTEVKFENNNVTNYTVTTPTGATFTQEDVTGGKFKVEYIGTYKIAYNYNGFVAEITFEAETASYEAKLVSNSSNILPEKVAVGFTGTFNLPQCEVYDEDGNKVEDVIVETTLTMPKNSEEQSYETKTITNGKIVFGTNAENGEITMEEGNYIVSYTAYSKEENEQKGAYLTQKTISFEALNSEKYDNEFTLTLAYSSQKPTSINVGKAVELPEVTAKNGSESVPVYYTVEVYKNGSETAVELDAEDEATGLTVLKRTEDGKYELTADEVGAYYRVEYTVKDALGNEAKTEFNINTVVDNINPTPLVVDAYEMNAEAKVVEMENKEYALKSIFGNGELVKVNAIYASDLATFKNGDFTLERKIENSSRETVYTNNNLADAGKVLVFNVPENANVAENEVNTQVTLKNGTYYAYYTVTDAHGNKNYASYKFVVDSTFVWGASDVPTVTFNDTFASSVELGEKITFGKVTAKDDNDERLRTEIYCEYYNGETLLEVKEEQTKLVLELNDENKYVVDTANAPLGATKVVIYAKAVNDGEKETIESKEIALKTITEGTHKPTIKSVDNYTANGYVQGDEIVLPRIVFEDLDGVKRLDASVSVVATYGTGDDAVVTNYSASNLMAVKVGNYYHLSNASFVAATEGEYCVAVKVVDAEGNTVVKFLNYSVAGENSTGELRFANLGLSDKTVELNETLSLTKATIAGTNNEDYAYAIVCMSSPAGANDPISDHEFKANVVGEYVVRYAMYKKPTNDYDEIKFVDENNEPYDYVEFTVTVKDTKGPKVNLVWETELVNGEVPVNKAIAPAYDVNTKILLPKVSASDESGIDFEKSTIVISSSKSTKTIKLSEMEDEYSATGEMYYTFTRNAVYTITYTVYDMQGNSSKVSKTVNVGDLVAPVLVVDDAICASTYSVGDTISISLEDTKNYLRVSDNKDTDLAKSDIVVKLYCDGVEVTKNSTSTDTVYNFTLSNAGSYELSFSVTDEAGWTTTESKSFTIQSSTKQAMTSTQIIGTVLIVVSVVILAGVIVYFIVSKKKMDKLYK